jgi:ubiquinol-cytochrome c reductase iron-sulfur subunit
MTVADDDVPADAPHEARSVEDLPFGLNPRHFGIDPGTPWPDDVPKDQDDTHWRFENDPRGARRAEMKVGLCWGVTIVASIALMVVYVQGYSNWATGLCWGLAFAGLGIGMLLWGRDLLPNVEVTASRGTHAVSHDADRVAVTESLGRGVESMARRPFIFKTLGAVGGLFGLATLFPLASLGPRPGNDLKHTEWGPGVRAVTQDGTPIRPGDLAVNGILTIFPEGHMDDALSPSLLINIGANQLHVPSTNIGWNIGPVVAFSKICTHAGCPASLYNVDSHQLVCPCHQSTFDVLEGCKPVFGPAPRSLPQLPITTDADGYVVSQRDYTQPVGPGFWNRGS